MYHGSGGGLGSADQGQGFSRAEPSVGSNVSNTLPRQPEQPRHPYYTVESEPQFTPQGTMPHQDEVEDTSPFAYNPPSTAGGAPPSGQHSTTQVPQQGIYQQTYQPYQYRQQPQTAVAARPTTAVPPSSAGSQHSQPFSYAPQPSYPPASYATQRQPPPQYLPPQNPYPVASYHGQVPAHSPTHTAHPNVGLGLPAFSSASGMPFPSQAQVQFPTYTPASGMSGQAPPPRLFAVGATPSYETRLFPDITAPTQQQVGSYTSASYNVPYDGQQSGPFLFGPGPYGDPQAGPSDPSHGRRLHREVRYEEDHKYHCPHCSFATERSPEFRRHMKKHGKTRTRPCSRCGKDFARSDALTRHQKGTKNCPRPKPKGEGDDGPKPDTDEPPADDDEEKADDDHEDDGRGEGNSGHGGSNQGTQRPGSGWSSTYGASEYQGMVHQHQHQRQQPENIQSRPVPSALQVRAQGLHLHGMHGIGLPSPLASSSSMPSSVTLASSALSSATASISPSASTTKFHTYTISPESVHPQQHQQQHQQQQQHYPRYEPPGM
ncbi:hypothetical protein DACRYDRAFT_15848 [Dacryopinax primogenitus]|uniref:C2H2-type domain-containing protein n=1 Tax=Dacryopinax primogenitus (strain DJM 731) TaxID=1858805 RepID=M5GCL9_DACPD|nr:uncharacterized protein DACRYDRAFT_15848 [Dacryopinax primogenitus]EJU01853.1 hypothetical protein DACRYDRAFT_15848 [Dacryopinax primogenitus]